MTDRCEHCGAEDAGECTRCHALACAKCSNAGDETTTDLVCNKCSGKEGGEDKIARIKEAVPLGRVKQVDGQWLLGCGGGCSLTHTASAEHFTRADFVATLDGWDKIDDLGLCCSQCIGERAP